MTTVTLFYHDECLIGFEAIGHTGSAEAGEDLLCAAVSGITQTVALGVKRHLQLPHAWEREDGYLFIQVDKGLPGDQLARVHDIFSTMRLGLESLALDHPQYLTIKERRD